MARGSDTAKGASDQAQANSKQQLGAATNISSLLVPTLQSTLANPQGINPTDMARIRTSNKQGAGGSAAAAVGDGALRAARTRNAGAMPAAVAEGVRHAGEQLSQADLAADLEDQKLKQVQRAGAQQGLQGLYGQTLAGGNDSLGQVAPLVNADTNAAHQSWDWAGSLFNPLMSNATQFGIARLKSCWIAEVIYGSDDPRTHLLRWYLNGPFTESHGGAAVMAVYRAIGRPVAWLARRSRLIRAALTPLFESALRRACA